MDFLKHWEGAMVFLSGFPPFSFEVYSNGIVEKLYVSLKKIEISRQSCRDDYE
jgi:hypothetical protein